MLSFIIYFQTAILQTIFRGAMILKKNRRVWLEECSSSLSNMYNILISKMLFKG